MQRVKFYNTIKIMHKILIFFLSLFCFINGAFAYDLVLPKEKKTYVSTNYAFFVGKAKKHEHITINDESVYVAPNGAFAHTIKLKNGENRIFFRTNYNTHVYKVYKMPKPDPTKPVLEEFSPYRVIVNKDNTPLRNTPIDYGMNRISHLFEGTNLIVNGQKGDFYRVKLSKKEEGWISKSSVTKSDEGSFDPKYRTMKSETFKNCSVHTLEFSEKLPYTIEETGNEILFKVYNPFLKEDSVYTVNIRKPEKYYYKTISSNGVYVFKVNELPYCDNNTLEGLTITVDAGHGGSEYGAVGCLGDNEKDINLSIANELKDILRQMGACVVMTRECDGFISLDDRVKMAKDNCSDIFVSIHLNSIPDIKFDVHKNRGTSVYYYNPNSKNLAKYVEESVTSAICTKKEGIKTASFAVIRPTDYLGILVENAYMTNPMDTMIYKSENFPRNTARGIAEGILNYVNSDK